MHEHKQTAIFRQRYRSDNKLPHPKDLLNHSRIADNCQLIQLYISEDEYFQHSQVKGTLAS